MCIPFRSFVSAATRAGAERTRIHFPLDSSGQIMLVLFLQRSGCALAPATGGGSSASAIVAEDFGLGPLERTARATYGGNRIEKWPTIDSERSSKMSRVADGFRAPRRPDQQDTGQICDISLYSWFPYQFEHVI